MDLAAQNPNWIKMGVLKSDSNINVYVDGDDWALRTFWVSYIPNRHGTQSIEQRHYVRSTNVEKNGYLQYAGKRSSRKDKTKFYPKSKRTCSKRRMMWKSKTKRCLVRK